MSDPEVVTLTDLALTLRDVTPSERVRITGRTAVTTGVVARLFVALEKAEAADGALMVAFLHACARQWRGEPCPVESDPRRDAFLAIEYPPHSDAYWRLRDLARQVFEANWMVGGGIGFGEMLEATRIMGRAFDLAGVSLDEAGKALIELAAQPVPAG